MITSEQFASQVNARKYIADMQAFDPKTGEDFLNAYGAKGPVFFVDAHGSPIYLLTDRKDNTYANQGIRNKLVHRGGNYREPTDLAPMDVWLRQLGEETQPRLLVPGISKETARRLRAAIIERAKVHNDYFTALPRKRVDNPNLPQPWYCDVCSTVSSEVPLELVDDIFQIPRGERTRDGYRQKLGLVSPESPQWLTPIGNLINGEHVLFGFGDDHKTKDLLKKIYDIDAHIQFVDDVEVVILDTDAMLPFAERRYLETFFRSDNNPLKRGSLETGRVFMKRDEPRQP
ncbi:MAG: hypothetical protein HYS62_01045 [Candidatus Aenigmarchaeota archaeon]|nr:hypothetical protein [Candidatus Aenigmarchaeota archaeon]